MPEAETDRRAIIVRARVSRTVFTVNSKVNYVREGTKVTLKCDPDKEGVSGIRRISWIYNGAMVATDTNYGNLTEENMLSRHFVGESEGSYNCLVNTTSGSLLSETVMLKIAVLTQIPFVHYWHHIIRDPHLLHCDVMGYFTPRGDVTWLKDKRDVRESPNLYIDIDGSLNFLYLTSDDFGKPYNCAVRSNILQQTITGNTTFVLKDTWTHREDRAPFLISSTETASAAQGDDVILECSFGGDPEPIVTWTRKYSHEARHKYIYPATKGKQLRIANISVSDGGSYACTAKNPQGEAASEIHLRVRRAPALAQPIESRVLHTGTSVKYHCAPEDGQLESRWILDGWPADGGVKDLIDGKTLIVNSRASTGNFCAQCNVSSDIAYTLYSACVTYVVLQKVKLWTIIVPVTVGSIIIIIIITIVIIIGVSRRNRGIPTVETDLPITASLYLEAHQLIERQLSHLQNHVDGQRGGI
ncbi:immunoglobulin superfamily DCC subclass member 4-like [Haliotis asinina]|uniref:immunoglobulin superfamily DCC subclass member 4-like n=1 Tax=Haliotis asinina TaxID=109174 RepID=UPI0035321836